MSSAIGPADEHGSQPSVAWHRRWLLWLASRSEQFEVEGPALRRYFVALVALASATLARWLFDPVLENRAPYGMYLLAVLFVVWRAGFGPALVTVLAGTFLGRFLFDLPRFSLWITESNQASLAMSLSIGIAIVLVCRSLRMAARDNQRLLELARQSEARKDEFLATLAHELRNPLMPIRNAVYLLERIEKQEPRVVELQRLIGRHAEHLIRLVNDLLDLSRITQRKIELRFENVGLRSIVDDAVEPVRPLIHEKQQQLHVSLPSNPVELHADGVRLTQVLTNLLQNAAKYTGKEGQIWLSAATEDDDLVLRVRDTGIGIAPDMCERVFDLFQQAHQGIEDSRGGLGIGLTLVRVLVHLHGGTVQARSAGVGLGSEFVVRLPVALLVGDEPRPLRSEESQETQTPRDGALRILIVEDSPAVASTLQMILLDWNHIVEVCADGFAALEVARTFKPDIVLADLGMPRMNGYQLAAELRRLPAMRAATFIAISGYGQPGDQQRSLAAGFVRHLVKPVDLVELQEVLATYGYGSQSIELK